MKAKVILTTFNKLLKGRNYSAPPQYDAVTYPR